MTEHKNKLGSLHEKALSEVKQSFEARGGADPASNKRFIESWNVWLNGIAKNSGIEIPPDLCDDMQALEAMLNHLGGGRPMALGDTITQRLKGCLLRAEVFQATARSVEIVPHKSVSLAARRELTNASKH